MPELTDYYVAAGRSLAALEEHDAASLAYWKAVLEVGEKHGVRTLNADWLVTGQVQWYSSDNAFAGFFVPEERAISVELLTRGKPKTCCLPNARTKAGKALRDDLRALKPARDVTLCYKLCGNPYAWIGAKPQGFSRDYLNDKHILSCPAGGFPPYDALPLARSVYWQMREASEAVSA